MQRYWLFNFRFYQCLLQYQLQTTGIIRFSCDLPFKQVNFWSIGFKVIAQQFNKFATQRCNPVFVALGFFNDEHHSLRVNSAFSEYNDY